MSEAATPLPTDPDAIFHRLAALDDERRALNYLLRAGIRRAKAEARRGATPPAPGEATVKPMSVREETPEKQAETAHSELVEG
jgi:hypothetical protein